MPDKLNAFGLPDKHKDGFDSHDAVLDAILNRLPALPELVQDALQSAIVCGSAAHRVAGHRSVSLLVNQAVNDFQDLLADLVEGRGRPATRAARALVEHAVNLTAVTASQSDAERYARHTAVRGQVEADARIGLGRLTGKERAAEEHRLRKLARDTKPAYDAARADYGNGFARGWADRSLRERAEAHGLGDLYAYYRLSSMVLHGSAGGAEGSINDAYHARVHRVGPALALCVNAYHEGVRAFQVVARHMEQVAPVAPHRALRESLAALLDGWTDYRAAIRAVDEWMWPAHAPPGPQAVLAVFRNGTRRWYWHEPSFDVVIEADPPAGLPHDRQEHLEAVVRHGMRGLAPTDMCLSVHVAGIVVSPKHGAKTMPASTILIPRDGGRLHHRPVVLDGDTPTA